jgi:Acyl-CoA dehydrogenase, N-terminal domain/Acyl-CoA dehydrogenase, middle domain/Acyl-CoA dehydrogenase, C-terminal domain
MTGFLMQQFEFPMPATEPAEAALRREVRAFLAEKLTHRTPRERAQSWNGYDAAFSRELGRRGWIGMSWPKHYGGHERSALERYVVMEEMLAAGAPVAAHWMADRQSGPLLLRFGTEEQRQTFLPRIARGECFFCIGMSEPDSGSDLAAARTRALAVDGGFRVTGTKLWTTYGHRAHYMILFCRTSEGKRQEGVSQLLIDLASPGITISPVLEMSGAHHFNEVSFDDVFVPANRLIGREGQGWTQVMSELAFERSGPERFLSTLPLLIELTRELGADWSPEAQRAIGRLFAHLVVLRHLSRSVAGMLEAQQDPALQAALVKDLGAVFEQEIPELARLLVAAEPSISASSEYAASLAVSMMAAPSFSLRGGTREILRGIIARGLGLR